jgi:dipeptidyl aminopeptidase/acylaminoacyl peptidase
MSSYGDFRSSLRIQQMLALSPDGRQVAYADDASGQFNLTIRPVDPAGQARRLTTFRDHTVRDAAWHPHRPELVFLADRDGDEHTQIYLVPEQGGDPNPLTDNPDAEFTLPMGGPFTRDGRLFAYAGNDRTSAHQDVMVRDLATDRIQRVDTGEGQAEAGYWSPDGGRLSLTRVYHGYDRIVHVAHADGSPSTRLTFDEVPCDYQLGPWLPDGSGFLVRTDRGREFTGLAVLHATTGALTWLETPPWDVELAALCGDGRVLAWVVNENGFSRLYARDRLSGKDIAVPPLPAGRVSQLKVSPDGATAVMVLTTATRPWNVAVADLRDATFSWLTGAVATSADPASLVEPELVTYPGDAGHQIPALVYRPHRAGGPVGVVISVHGGPKFQERPVYNYEGFYQYLVAKGLAVVAPNIRGSDGYGKTYQRQINRDWGNCDLADMAATVRYLKAQDWVDPGRLALVGRSYGAFVVLTCLARLSEAGWAAAVEFFGPSNLVTAAEAVPPAYRATSNEVLGNPDTERESLLARSPITYAENIKAPLFVVQGARDRRVPRGESDQLVQRLRALGAEVRYDVYPDEGHGFTKSANEMKAYSDAAEFLIAHLT